MASPSVNPALMSTLKWSSSRAQSTQYGRRNLIYTRIQKC